VKLPIARIEGGDPRLEDDEILGIVPRDNAVPDEEAQDAIRDILGGSGNAGFHAQVILKRFAEKRWRIVKER